MKRYEAESSPLRMFILVKKMRRKTDQNKGKLYFERQPGKAEDQKGGDTGD